MAELIHVFMITSCVMHMLWPGNLRTHSRSNICAHKTAKHINVCCCHNISCVCACISCFATHLAHLQNRPNWYHPKYMADRQQDC